MRWQARALFFIGVFGCLISLATSQDPAGVRVGGLSGTWRDDCNDNQCYGGEMYLCVDEDDVVHGRYSDIGYLVGKVSDRKVEGYWFEAGYAQQNHGGFEWRFSRSNHTEFTGSWWYAERHCDRFAWSSQQIDGTFPTLSMCGKPLFDKNEDNQFLYEGLWASETGETQIALCHDQRGYFHGSGDLSGDAINIAGISYLSHQTLSASFWRSNGDLGIMLVNVLSNVEIAVSWWNVKTNHEAVGRFDSDSSLHASVFLRRAEADATELSDLCVMNEQIGGLDWTGSWFDRRFGDGFFFTCADDNSAQGIFSEVGWVEASREDDVIFGEYYTFGARPDFDRGIFQLALTNHGHSFEGIYQVDGHERRWTSDRADATDAYSDQCFPPAAGSVEGEWTYGKHAGDFMSICISDGQVEMSYQYNGKVVGYGLGYTSDSGPHTIQVAWFEERANGIAMYRISENDELLEVFWEGLDIAGELDFAFCHHNALDFQYWGRHSKNKLVRYTSGSNEVNCARNRYLMADEVFPLVKVPDVPSSASMLTHTLVEFILIVCFVTLLI